jgi:hypothetical protein
MEAPLTVDIKGSLCEWQFDLYSLALDCGCFKLLTSLPNYASCPQVGEVWHI